MWVPGIYRACKAGEGRDGLTVLVSGPDGALAFRPGGRTGPVRATSCIARSPAASYTAARKPRGGSGTVPASARRALPFKRRSG